MKKTAVAAALAVFLAASWLSLPVTLQAEADFTTLRELDLKNKPLDVTPSADGELLFILAPGEVLIYSIRAGKITERVPIGMEFDHIAASPRGNLITVTSSTKNTLQILLLDFTYAIDVTGRPFKGPQNAPVVVVVFTDYQ
jgi:hypothetical protein